MAFRNYEGLNLSAMTALLTAFLAPIGIQVTGLSWWLILPAAAAVSVWGVVSLFWLLAWLGR